MILKVDPFLYTPLAFPFTSSCPINKCGKMLLKRVARPERSFAPLALLAYETIFLLLLFPLTPLNFKLISFPIHVASLQVVFACPLIGNEFWCACVPSRVLLHSLILPYSRSRLPLHTSAFHHRHTALSQSKNSHTRFCLLLLLKWILIQTSTLRYLRDQWCWLAFFVNRQILSGEEFLSSN